MKSKKKTEWKHPCPEFDLDWLKNFKKTFEGVDKCCKIHKAKYEKLLQEGEQESEEYYQRMKNLQ